MRRAQMLLESAKDRMEHQIVVDAITQALSPHCYGLVVPKQPALIQTPTMWHLSTRIRGRVRRNSPSSLELAQLIHPTPAVCGEPTLIARKTISSLEKHERGFFSGFSGWCDSKGDGEWAVAIRCGEASAQNIRLYAGAGIVSESDPEKEWDETTAKLRTMLEVFHLTLDDISTGAASS